MKAVLVAALGAMVASVPVCARDHGGWADRDMTRQQAQQQADSMFQRFDLNHDGIVTRDEAEQAAQQFGGSERAERMIERMFGASQSLTLQQAEAQALGRFDRDDLNHDGIVSAAERQQVRGELKAARAASSAPGQ